MKNSKFVRSAAFAVALMFGGAGMAGTAFAQPNTGRGPTTKAKAKQQPRGCMWNGVASKDGDVVSKTVHHADGSSEVVDYTCKDGTWIS